MTVEQHTSPRAAGGWSGRGETVCVTGAAGFVAAHLVEQLLAAGHRVRGTVRDPSKASAVAHLRALPGADRLELFAADLLQPGSFAEAMRGASAVFHTASPYVLTPEDAQRDLVDPAVLGTRNVLETSAATPSVTRVILTSSVAAITDEPDGRVLTEADWNETSSLTRNPYYFSKTVAERAAWDFVAEKKPGFDLVSINPFVIFGPAHSAAQNISNQILIDILAGKYPGILSLCWGIVDVRDVARAHLRAWQTPTATGRYLCAAGTMPMRQVVEVIRAVGYRKLPWLGLDNGFGDLVVRALAQFQPKGARTYLRTHIGRVVRFDNGKIQRDLGMTFRPIDATIRDTLADLQRWGHIAAPA